jgi:DNA-binding response OmpR family regulator
MFDSQASHVNILAIDDHPDVLGEITRILHRVGYECLRALDLGEAATLASRTVPDLIVADAHLMGRHGLSTCEQLRRLLKLEDVPVMFLSSAQSPDIIRRAGTGGGSYSLRKPFDAPVFVELVERTRRVPRQQLASV